MKLTRFGNRCGPTCYSLICAALLASGSAVGQDHLSSEPFSVFVAQEKTFARCGPSDEHYRTDALRQGQQLDVYLETDDGWLGVRPPESSFCWIPASAVQIANGGETAKVIEDRTVSWIGTNLGRARQYRWQVQMAEGEQVTILGRSERDGPDGPQTWLRIVPPSGEFRWVHRDQVVESAEELVASLRQESRPDDQQLSAMQETPDNKPLEEEQSGLTATIVQTANSIKQRLSNSTPFDPHSQSSRRNPEPGPTGQATLAVVDETPQLQPAPAPHTDEVAANVVGSGVQESWSINERREQFQQPESEALALSVSSPATQTAVADASVAASTEFIGRPRLLDIGANTSAPQNNVAAADSNWVINSGRMTSAEMNLGHVRPAAFDDRVTTASAQAHTVAAENIQRVASEARDADVEKLQLLLSRLMASGASAAEVEPIVTGARNLSMTSLDQVAAGRARLVAERAEQYQRVARRRDGNTVIRENGIPVIPASGVLPASGVVNAPSAMPSASGGDMQTGFLVQVYSARQNSPPFALTDHAGNTIAYVTPSPGINLRGHLNSHIKVIGSRGFLQGLNMPHILVSQAARTPE